MRPIEVENTPNPRVKKFLLDQEVASDPIEFSDFAQARSVSEPAARLFELDQVAGVYLGDKFVSVTVKSENDWPRAQIMILDVLEEARETKTPFVRNRVKAETAERSEVAQRIFDLIEERVRPAVAEDGGDIQFHDFKDGVVYLTLHGACAGCPSAQATLRHGVEGLLKHFVPEVERVEQFAG